MNYQSPQAFMLGREGVPLHLTQPQLALFTRTVSDSLSHPCSARHTLMHTGMITHLSITCRVTTYTTVCIPDQHMCLETHCTHWALCTFILTHTYASIHTLTFAHSFIYICTLTRITWHSETCLCTLMPACGRACALGSHPGS